MTPPAITHLARAARAGDELSLARVRIAVSSALREHEGNRARAARALGVSLRTLGYWLSPLAAPHARGLGLEALAAEWPVSRGRPRGKPGAPSDSAA